MATIVDLIPAAIDAMRQVYDGGIVFDVNAANLLIYAHLNYPELILIGDVPDDLPRVTDRPPIFIAALTQEGKEYIDAL